MAGYDFERPFIDQAVIGRFMTRGPGIDERARGVTAS